MACECILRTVPIVSTLLRCARNNHDDKAKADRLFAACQLCCCLKQSYLDVYPSRRVRCY